MSTTEEFIHSINSDNLSSCVINCFDELMVLYNLIGHRQDLDICTEDDASVSATFLLLMESEKDAKVLYENLNESSFSVYNDNYNIKMEISGASVKTTIQKDLS